MAKKLLVSLLLQKVSSVTNLGINIHSRHLYLARIVLQNNILAFQTQPFLVKKL